MGTRVSKEKQGPNSRLIPIVSPVPVVFRFFFQLLWNDKNLSWVDQIGIAKIVQVHDRIHVGVIVQGNGREAVAGFDCIGNRRRWGGCWRCGGRWRNGCRRRAGICSHRRDRFRLVGKGIQLIGCAPEIVQIYAGRDIIVPGDAGNDAMFTLLPEFPILPAFGLERCVAFCGGVV